MNIDIISLGELLIDFVPTNRGISFEKAAGGAPANVAVACSRLGLRSGFIGKVGDDEFGRPLRNILKKEGVDTSNVRLERGANTTRAFVSIDDDGEHHFQFHRGADAQLKPDEIDDDYIAGAQVFHFGSISLVTEPARSATLKAVKIAEKNGLTVTYDPNLRLSLWKNMKKARKWIGVGLEMADVVKLNEEEVKFILRLDIEDAAERLLESVDKVFISLGNRGCYYADENSKGYSDPYKVEVRDTIGAGDGFMGGVIYGTLKGWRIERTASFSNAVGALTTNGLGGIPSLPTLNDVLRLIAKFSPMNPE